PATGAWPRRRPVLATVPAEPAAPAGPSCCRRRGLAAARTRAGDATGLEALQRARATPAGARALAAPWLRLASPTHTGEGAEGRRELRAGGREERRPLRKG